MNSRHFILERQGFTLLVALACLAWPGGVFAQDLEPRRWTHLPVGTNVAGLAYVYTDGDLFFDPVLELEDVKMESNTIVGSYTRTFGLFGKTGRVDALVPYQTSRWDGLLSGSPASTQREGLSDPWLRLSINLVGSPPLEGKEFLEYHSTRAVHTVVGVAFGVMLPLGEYQSEKLLNLGQNRFCFRPQAGVTHTRGAWTYELTGSMFLYTDNDDFFGDNTREQDPLYAFQAHVIHSFPSRWWASISAGYDWGGESAINGQDKEDDRSNLLSALTVGLPIGKTQGIKFGYLRGDTQNDVGSNSNNFFAGWNVRF